MGAQTEGGIPVQTVSTGLTERLRIAYRLAERQQALMAVLVLEFSSDSLGTLPESRQQRFLETLPGRLQKVMRSMDYVSEPFGDARRFLLVATLQELDELQPIVRRVRSALVNADEELEDVVTSIGVAVYPFDSGSPETLLSLATETAAGGLGSARHYFRYANEDLQMRLEAADDLRGSMVQGLRRGEFEVLYQPMVAAHSGLPVAIEALLHWRHPERGMLTPGQYLPVSWGNTWLMRELDEWVLSEVARAAPTFASLQPSLKISLNLRPDELLNGDFIAHLKQQLAACPALAEQRLVFELPRDSLLGEDKRVSAAMAAGHELGVRWSLDADLAQLSLDAIARLPLEWVKVDGREMPPPAEEADRHAGFHALGQMMAALGRRTVFTHIEDPALAAALGDMPATLLQGYGIAAPMSPPVLRDWLRTRS